MFILGLENVNKYFYFEILLTKMRTTLYAFVLQKVFNVKGQKSYYPLQRSWGKVMFSQACVILFTGGGGGHVWLPGDMHGCRGHAWLGGHAWLLGGVRCCQGACVVAGGHAWLLEGVCVVAGGHVWLQEGACMVVGGGMCGYQRCVVAGGHAWL